MRNLRSSVPGADFRDEEDALGFVLSGEDIGIADAVEAAAGDGGAGIWKLEGEHS